METKTKEVIYKTLSRQNRKIRENIKDIDQMSIIIHDLMDTINEQDKYIKTLDSILATHVNYIEELKVGMKIIIKNK